MSNIDLIAPNNRRFLVRMIVLAILLENTVHCMLLYNVNVYITHPPALCFIHFSISLPHSMDVLFLFLFKGEPTAWQSLKNVVAGVFTPLVKGMERLLFPGETGVC